MVPSTATGGFRAISTTVTMNERWELINNLFHAALEREPSQRPAFLTQACVDDEALCREVESLIASHEQADTFIEMPAADLAAELLTENQTRLTPVMSWKKQGVFSSHELN